MGLRVRMARAGWGLSCRQRRRRVRRRERLGVGLVRLRGVRYRVVRVLGSLHAGRGVVGWCGVRRSGGGCLARLWLGIGARGADRQPGRAEPSQAETLATGSARNPQVGALGHKSALQTKSQSPSTPITNVPFPPTSARRPALAQPRRATQTRKPYLSACLFVNPPALALPHPPFACPRLK